MGIKIIVDEEDYKIEYIFNRPNSAEKTTEWKKYDASVPCEYIANLCEQIKDIVMDYREEKRRRF